MVPSPERLTPPRADGRILPSGRAIPDLREDLRRVPSLRNAISVVSCFAQMALVIGGAIWLHNPFAWVGAFLLMGRSHAQLAALMHEAAHRLLFRNRKANDLVGRWLLGYIGFTNTDGYRRVHMAHHREEFGPEEPDMALYAGYPIPKESFRRKLERDATGQTGWKLLKQQLEFQNRLRLVLENLHLRHQILYLAIRRLLEAIILPFRLYHSTKNQLSD